jgi:hypothetical protein
MLLQSPPLNFPLLQKLLEKVVRVLVQDTAPLKRYYMERLNQAL